MVQPRVMGVAVTEANVTVEKAMDQHGKLNTEKNHIGVVGVAKIVFLPCTLYILRQKYLRPSPAKTSKKLLQKIGTKKKKLLQNLSLTIDYITIKTTTTTPPYYYN